MQDQQAGGFNGERLAATIQRVHANIDRLLAIESRAQSKYRRSRDALVHAGKMASVGRMVAGINHEIKRPLASIRLLTECSLDLLAAGDTARVAENLQRVIRVVDLISNLSRRLECFSRKVEPAIEPVCVSSAIADALAVLAPQVQAAQCKVAVLGDRPMVVADRDRLTFVIVNLVDNAIAASAGAADKTIEVHVDSGPECTLIRVRDHGAGLDERALEHLFEEFFTTKPLDKGLGLGLSLAREMVREMGGEIRGGNHALGGAEFSVRLGSGVGAMGGAMLIPPSRDPSTFLA
jgi:two-component system C4-dicarboxylate transport sensor histidine kinase DctB